jgi:hypothetical protein
MADDFDDILSGESDAIVEEAQPAAEPVVEEAETPAVEAEAEPTEVEPVETETEEADPAAEPVAAKTVPLPALTEERTKRQEAEAKYKVLEDMIKANTQAQQPVEQPKAAPIPDPIADPEGFAAYTQQSIDHRVQATRLDMSEDLARSKHGDEAVEAALEAAKLAGPNVFNKFQHERNPYEALIKWHTDQRVVTEIGDPAAFREKMVAEIRAEIQAEMVAEQAKVLAGNSAPSLAGNTNVGVRGQQAWTGPKSIDDILGG